MPKGALKVTPFSLFMKFRKPQLLRQGHEFQGGWKDVANAVSEEWKVWNGIFFSVSVLM